MWIHDGRVLRKVLHCIGSWFANPQTDSGNLNLAIELCNFITEKDAKHCTLYLIFTSHIRSLQNIACILAAGCAGYIHVRSYVFNYYAYVCRGLTHHVIHMYAHVH